MREATGRDVHLAGYSQGGMFCYQAAAYLRGEGIDSVITFGSPVDTRGALPLGIPEEIAEAGAGLLAGGLRPHRGAGVDEPHRLPAARPGQVAAPADRLRPPASRPRGAAAARAPAPLPDGGGVGRVARARRVADFMRQFIAHNRMLAGRLRDRRPHRDPGRHRPPDAHGRRHGRRDRPGARGARDRPRRAAARRSTSSRCGPATSAWSSDRWPRETTWPAVAGWTRWRAGEGELPDGDRAGERAASRGASRRASARGSASGSGSPPASAPALARSLAGAASRTLGGARELAEELRGELPRLARLGRLRPDTRVSLGLLLDEQARDAPERRLLPLRGPRLQPRGRQPARRQRRPRPALARRAPGRARRRADGDAAERAVDGRGAQPARRRRRC